MLHVQDEYDYHLTSKHREELIDSLKLCYFNEMNDNIPIYGLKDKITAYFKNRDDMLKNVLPEEIHRLQDEDEYEPFEDFESEEEKDATDDM